MPDALSDTFVTVAADGTITFTFTGSIHAQGLILDYVTSPNPINKARWLRPADNLEGAEIFAYDAAGNPTMNFTLIDPDAGSFTCGFQLFGHTAGARSEVHANAADLTNSKDILLLDSRGTSQFLQFITPPTAAAGRALILQQVSILLLFNGTTTYTPSANTIAYNAECVGGGGAGGGAAATGVGQIACGGGGAGGGYARTYVLGAIVSAHTVAIGAGATGGTGNGGAGGDTSLTPVAGEIGIAPLAKGGAGAEGGAAVAAANVFSGGGNQAGGTGEHSSWGTPGGWGTIVAVGAGNYPGNGGAGGMGYGGTINVKINTASGKGAGQSAPAGSGGGGSGAGNGQSQTATNGGNGGAGILRITEYRTLNA